MPCMDSPVLSSKLDTADLNYTATSRALRQLKTNASSGPDGLPPIMFKKPASELAYPLSLLFQSSMSTVNFRLNGRQVPSAQSTKVESRVTSATIGPSR